MKLKENSGYIILKLQEYLLEICGQKVCIFPITQGKITFSMESIEAIIASLIFFQV